MRYTSSRLKAPDWNWRRLVSDGLSQARDTVLTGLLGMLATFSTSGMEPVPSLFLAADSPGKETILQSASAAGTSSLVQFNPALQALLRSPAAAAPIRVTMTLGNGGIIELTFTNRLSLGADRVVWRGKAGTRSGGFVTLALNGAAAAGSIFAPGTGSYQIQYAGHGKHRVRRMDDVQPPPCGVRPRAAGASPPAMFLEPLFSAASMPPESNGTTNTVLDLLVVYTAAARSGAGDTNGMIALIDAAVAEANLAFENSQVNARLQLVRSAEIDYTESGSISEDLDQLEDDSEDGPLYNVRQLRGQSRADLVCLITETTGGPYGLANQMREVEVDFGEKAFSVIQREFAVAYLSLAHEIGHNLGCQHDRTTSPFGGAFDFSHALRFEVDGTLYHTVMAYQPGLPVPYFSNPDVSFLGIPTGIAAPATNSADNARTINLSAATAARFDSVMPRGTPPSVALLSPTNGSTFIAPAVVQIIADAYDEDGRVVEVEFYVNGVQVGHRLQPPFNFSWTNSVPGTYTLLAEARDNAGWEVNSALSRIQLLPPAPAIDLPECGLVAGGMFQVRVKGFDGQAFRLEASTNLVNWTTLVTDELVGETLDYLDAQAPDNMARFYRVLPAP